jgi:NDP-sugar pyrophosphorylase family protein
MYDTVFITTSGLGTRLEGLTQYTNKALVPIGDRYAICRIIERFPTTTRFVVSLGYYADHVRDFLELAYPDRQFVFVTVDRYSGEGSSQAYSMLCARDALTEPFLYHCCDTVLPADIEMPKAGEEDVTMFVAPHADYTTYSGITVADGKLVRINRKSEAIHDYAYIGLAYVRSPVTFWNTLEEAWISGNKGGWLGDTDAYRRMLEHKKSVGYRVLPQFYDTGNMDSYRHACRAFPSSAIVLAKPNESLCFLGRPGEGRVLKFLHSASANARRVRRGKMLEACGGPTILGEKPNFLAMSYEEGDVLAECREWGEVRRLLDWAKGLPGDQWMPCWHDR